MDEKTDEYILPRVFLNKGEETEIRQGFPWVFDNEIAFIKENGKNAEKTPLSKTTLTDGCAVNVVWRDGFQPVLSADSCWYGS